MPAPPATAAGRSLLLHKAIIGQEQPISRYRAKTRYSYSTLSQPDQGRRKRSTPVKGMRSPLSAKSGGPIRSLCGSIDCERGISQSEITCNLRYSTYIRRLRYESCVSCGIAHTHVRLSVEGSREGQSRDNRVSSAAKSSDLVGPQCLLRPGGCQAL